VPVYAGAPAAAFWRTTSSSNVFNRYEESLSDEDVASLSELFELGDNELMDLLLARKELDGELDTPPMQRLISLLRSV
jgi:antitoxin CptB